jgi:hypothetical protein
MRLRASLALVAFIAVAFPTVALAPSACADEAGHAALVVDTGSKVHSYCVTLDGGSVTGLRLIELAHDQYGLSYRTDGAAVCMLAGTGPATGDCFGDYPDFWGYWRGDGSGGWIWSDRGAASTTVRGGDVQGWSWGSGDDGSSHPPPPEVTFASVCGAAASAASPAPTPTKTRRPQSKPSPSPTAPAAPASSSAGPHASATPGATHSESRDKHEPPQNKPKKQRDRSSSGAAGVSPSPSSPPLGSGAITDPEGNRVPLAGVAALLLSGVLLAAGWLFLRWRNLNA